MERPCMDLENLLITQMPGKAEGEMHANPNGSWSQCLPYKKELGRPRTLQFLFEFFAIPSGIVCLLLKKKSHVLRGGIHPFTY